MRKETSFEKKDRFDFMKEDIFLVQKKREKESLLYVDPQKSLFFFKLKSLEKEISMYL